MKYSRMSVNAELGSIWKGKVFIYLNELRNFSKTSQDDCAIGV
jgi:hypothetical protein